MQPRHLQYFRQPLKNYRKSQLARTEHHISRDKKRNSTGVTNRNRFLNARLHSSCETKFPSIIDAIMLEVALVLWIRVRLPAAPKRRFIDLKSFRVYFGPPYPDSPEQAGLEGQTIAGRLGRIPKHVAGLTVEHTGLLSSSKMRGS